MNFDFTAKTHRREAPSAEFWSLSEKPCRGGFLACPDSLERLSYTDIRIGS
jgi:hypothetical protein